MFLDYTSIIVDWLLQVGTEFLLVVDLARLSHLTAKDFFFGCLMKDKAGRPHDLST
jgi:hypothetical protein